MAVCCRKDFTLPVDQDRALAAYVAGDSIAGLVTTAYVEPVGVGAKLPDMPAFLIHDRYVNVPLEATYKATWKTCPEPMRALVKQSAKAGGGS